MYTHDPDILALLAAMEQATGSPVALTCTISASGDEPLASDARSDGRVQR